VKVVYSLSFEDYQFLQPPFRLQAGKNPGFRIMMGALAFLAALGFLLVAQGFGLVHAFPGIEGGELPAGLLMLALSAAGALASYFLDKRSVRRALEKYGANIRSSYARIHCPDQRTFEADADGFVTSCRCGSIRRPWSELSRYSENDRFFLIGTKQDTHIVPKSAFDSPGSVTELRQLVLEKISSDRPFATPAIEFAYTKEDFRRAQSVHIRKGGGWRAWVRPVLVLSFCSFGLAGIWTWGEPRQDSLYWTGIVGLIVRIVFLRAFGGKKKHYLGLLRMYFSEDGLHLQDPASQGRTRWDQFLGYLEDSNVFLLYYNPKLYRIIPKRILGRREQEFRALIDTTLPRFNYRKPFPAAKVAVRGQSRPVA
jgi:YcxB-like protein